MLVKQKSRNVEAGNHEPVANSGKAAGLPLRIVVKNLEADAEARGEDGRRTWANYSQWVEAGFIILIFLASLTCVVASGAIGG